MLLKISWIRVLHCMPTVLILLKIEHKTTQINTKLNNFIEGKILYIYEICIFNTIIKAQEHDITSTCPTIRMTSLRCRDDTDATEEICIPHMLYLFLYHLRLDRRTPWVKFF
jgi:hypothetical protein